MEDKKDLSKYLHNMDTQNIDLLDKSLINDTYSNFRLLGIGKETEAQKARRAKLKKTLSDAGKNIEGTLKDAGKNIKGTIKDAGHNIKQTTKEVIHNDNLKKVTKGVFLKYNPAVAIPRSSALLAFRINLFGISTRLYPAFLSDEELVKYNFDVENAKHAREAWEKTANFWEDKIGGDRNKLREAISGAWNKPVFKTKIAKFRKASTSNFDGNYDNLYETYAYPTGAEETAVSTYILAGLPVVASIITLIATTRAKKNPYNEGSSDSQNYGNEIAGQNPPPVNAEEIKKIIDGAIDDKAKGLPNDNSGLDITDIKDDKILGIPKVAFWIGITAIVLIGGYFGYKKFISKK